MSSPLFFSEKARGFANDVVIFHYRSCNSNDYDNHYHYKPAVSRGLPCNTKHSV